MSQKPIPPLPPEWIAFYTIARTEAARIRAQRAAAARETTESGTASIAAQLQETR